MYRRIARKRNARSLVVSLPPPGTGATLPHCCQHNPGRAYIPSALALPRQRSHAAPERVATKRPAAPFVSYAPAAAKTAPRRSRAKRNRIGALAANAAPRRGRAKPPATLQAARLASASRSELHRSCPFQVLPSLVDAAFSTQLQVPRSRVARSRDGRGLCEAPPSRRVCERKRARRVASACTRLGECRACQ
jgi:hypothetical protein